MDEKTQQLRDLFLSVSDEPTITERQSAGRGSLGDAGVDEAAIVELIGSMRERYDFASTLDDEALATVARGFYAGDSDAAIARALDVSPEAVRRARLDLHLVIDRDLDAPFDLDALRRLRTSDATTAEQAAALDVNPSSVRRYGRALDAQHRRRMVGDQFREEFDRLLGDGEFSEQLTAAVKETGLEEATEDIETNVSF